MPALLLYAIHHLRKKNGAAELAPLMETTGSTVTSLAREMLGSWLDKGSETLGTVGGAVVEASRLGTSTPLSIVVMVVDWLVYVIVAAASGLT